MVWFVPFCAKSMDVRSSTILHTYPRCELFLVFFQVSILHIRPPCIDLYTVYCILHIRFPETFHKLPAVDLFANTGSSTRTCSLLYLLAKIRAPKSGPKICLVHLKGNNLIDLVGFGPTEVVFWVASPGNLEDPLLFDEGGLSTTSPEASSTRKLANTKFTTNSGSASMTSKVRFPTSKDWCFCIYNEQDPNKKNGSIILQT